MRVRITQSLHGNIDGIQLDRYVTGLIYEVSTTMGNYLLAEGWAVPVDEGAPALVTSLDDPVAPTSTPSLTTPTLSQRLAQEPKSPPGSESSSEE